VDDQVLAKAFLTDLTDAMASLRLDPGSILFLHTTTHRQIEPVVQAMELRQLRDCALVILLRYAPAPNPHHPNAETVARYRDALAAISRLGLADRVHLATDSDLLVEEYGAITDLAVNLLPIPHCGELVPPRDPDARPLIAYLGNARSTKGFQYLPHVVSRFRPRLATGEWAAEFQANVMFRHDLQSVMAVCALRSEPVTLREEELSPAEYDSLLERASLVVVPYQSLYYHAQTSGVFAEAMGRGIPVVVPRGTWMSRQLAASGAGVLFAPGDRADLADAVGQAMERIDELTDLARAQQPSWVKTHNPKNFVAAISRLGWSA
jgi:glycosyltransferase involved in cell wall biosynthesis